MTDTTTTTTGTQTPTAPPGSGSYTRLPDGALVENEAPTAPLQPGELTQQLPPTDTPEARRGGLIDDPATDAA